MVVVVRCREAAVAAAAVLADTAIAPVARPAGPAVHVLVMARVHVVVLVPMLPTATVMFAPPAAEPLQQTRRGW